MNHTFIRMESGDRRVPMYTDSNLGNPGKGWKKRTVSCHDSVDFFFSSEYMTVSVIDTLPVFVSVWIRFCTGSQMWTSIGDDDEPKCTYTYFCGVNSLEDKRFWEKIKKKNIFLFLFFLLEGGSCNKTNRESNEEEAIRRRSCLRAHSFLSGPRKQ